ncbi:MAG: hypothetical protein MR999_12060 [Flintibacter sp.]|uniref:hypothetical protein n=1 Tax=Flintibacter sp. TaxID=1918624 RepID=UPI002D806DFF|nr:hypothetical protein [Flintibacter sp.]MCI7160121.1 hypothetical protein [Flintibacter sp.]
MTDIQNMQNWKKHLEIMGSRGKGVWVKSEKISGKAGKTVEKIGGGVYTERVRGRPAKMQGGGKKHAFVKKRKERAA